MLNYHSTSQTQIPKQIHKNNFSTYEHKTHKKTSSTQKQHHSNSAVKLGEYIRQREHSKQKEIFGQIKSSQLIGKEDLTDKQLKFKKENVNILYDKIAAEIVKKKSNLASKSFEDLCKLEQHLQEILKIFVGSNTEEIISKIPSSTQTTDTSITTNLYSHLFSNKLDNKQVRFKTQVDLFSPKYKISQNILQQLKLKEVKLLQPINKYGDKYQTRYISTQKKEIQKLKNVSTLSDQNSKQSPFVCNTRMRRPPIVPKKLQN